MKTAALIRLRRRGGFSMMEMVLSLSVLAVAFSAVGSVLILAAKVMPDPGSAEAAGVDQADALTRLTQDLRAARFITDYSNHAVTLVVDDRSGDGLPDRIDYAWSGDPGDVLSYRINGSAPVDLVSGVESFTFALDSASTTDSIAAISEAGPEVALLAHLAANDPGQYELEETVRGIGQRLAPTLPGGEPYYAVTRARFRAKQKGPVSGTTYVRLYAVENGLPIGDPLAEATLDEGDLGSEYAWVEVGFGGTVLIPAGEAVAVCLVWKDDVHSASIEYDLDGGEGLVVQASAGDLWVQTPGQGMVIELLGAGVDFGPGIDLTQDVYTQARLTLQVGAAPAQQVAVGLPREPRAHTSVWDLGFDANPLVLDLNGDGPDWDGYMVNDSAFVGRRWLAGGTLSTLPEQAIAAPTSVDLVMGGDSSSDDGALCLLNIGRPGGAMAPIIVQVGQDSGGEHFIHVYDHPGLTRPRLTAYALGESLPSIRLLISPADAVVGLIANRRVVGAFDFSDALVSASGSGSASAAVLSNIHNGVFDQATVTVGGTADVTVPDVVIDP